MIYGILFLFEAVVCYFYDKRQFNNVKAFYVYNYKLNISLHKSFLTMAIVMPLWLVMGLRYRIGTDYRAYEEIFRQAALYNSNTYNMEWGYYYLNRIGVAITHNEQIIFFLSGLLIILFLFKGIEKSNGSMYYGILAFMGLGNYFYAMNLQRQYIAIMIMFYALHFLEKKQTKKYLVCVIAAAFFHISAIIWIPVYFAVNYLPTKLFYWGSLGLAIVIDRLGTYALTIIANMGFYTGQILNNRAFLKSRMSIMNVLLSGLFLVCGAIFYRRLMERKIENIIYIKLIWIMFLIYTFFNQFGNAGIRVAIYLCVAYFMLLPEISFCFNKKSEGVTRVVFTVALVALMYIIITNDGNASQRFLPYQYRMLWG